MGKIEVCEKEKWRDVYAKYTKVNRNEEKVKIGQKPQDIMRTKISIKP